MLVDGAPVRFSSPRDALDRGIATVYQDLAMVPLMSITRNFFMGREPVKGRGPFQRFDHALRQRAWRARRWRRSASASAIRRQAVGTLSGGERQCVAIARAVYFGARVLILDEPTSALGVKQAVDGAALRRAGARRTGSAVIFITHNVQHAYPVGDRFMLLNRGRSMGFFRKSEISREEVTSMMAGGAEMQDLEEELARIAKSQPICSGRSAGERSRTLHRRHAMASTMRIHSVTAATSHDSYGMDRRVKPGMTRVQRARTFTHPPSDRTSAHRPAWRSRRSA